MDYRERPGTAMQWRQRKQMQDRYLGAKNLRGESPRLPNGLKRIRMFPEWGARIPPWGDLPDPYPAGRGEISIGDDLEAALTEWSLEWESSGFVSGHPESWRERGWELYERVQACCREVVEVLPLFD